MRVPTSNSAALLVLGAIALALAALLTAGVDRARAAYPGEDGLIAFQRTVENNTGGFADRIVTVRKNGTHVNPITPLCCQLDEDPAWSPDGERIAFGHFPPGGRIVTMNKSGNEREHVTSGRRFEGRRFVDSDPSWSPDGTEIAYFRQQGSGLSVGGGYDLFVVDADGSNVRPILTNDLDELEPAWSPGGEWIAFVAQGVGEPGLPSGIYRMRPDGSDRQLIVELRDLRRGLDWSPDGELLTFSTRAEGRGPEVYTVRSDGTDLTRLTNEPRSAFDPAFSPEGDRIVYTVRGVLKVMDSDGGHARQLLERSSGVGDFAPSWQPK